MRGVRMTPEQWAEMKAYVKINGVEAATKQFKISKNTYYKKLKDDSAATTHTFTDFVTPAAPESTVVVLVPISKLARVLEVLK